MNNNYMFLFLFNGDALKGEPVYWLNLDLVEVLSPGSGILIIVLVPGWTLISFPVPVTLPFSSLVTVYWSFGLYSTFLGPPFNCLSETYLSTSCFIFFSLLLFSFILWSFLVCSCILFYFLFCYFLFFSFLFFGF